MIMLNIPTPAGQLDVEIDERDATVVTFRGDVLASVSRRLRAAVREQARKHGNTVTLHEADITPTETRVLLACGAERTVGIVRAAVASLSARAEKRATAQAAPPPKRRPTPSTPHIYSRSRRHAA